MARDLDAAVEEMVKEGWDEDVARNVRIVRWEREWKWAKNRQTYTRFNTSCLSHINTHSLFHSYIQTPTHTQALIAQREKSKGQAPTGGGQAAKPATAAAAAAKASAAQQQAKKKQQAQQQGGKESQPPIPPAKKEDVVFEITEADLQKVR